MATTIILATTLLAVAWIISSLAKRLLFIPKVKVPHIAFEGDNSPLRYITEAGNLLAEGYNKYTKNGQPFATQNAADPKRPIIILPMRYLDEVKNAPQTQLSFPAFMAKASVIDDICGPHMTEEAQKIIRMDLNKHLNDLIRPLQKVISEAYTKEMPPCPQDLISLNPYPLLAQIFARVAAFVLVGPELCQDSGRWLSLSRDYVNAVTKAPVVVRQKYHPLLRWTAKYFDPSVKTVLKYRAEGAELLRPTLEKRTAELDKGQAGGHHDAVQWLIEEFRARQKKMTPDALAQALFVIMTAAIDSTSATALWMLFDLLQNPDALTEIREEIGRVKDSFQKPDEKEFTWTRQSLGELRVLDSFMRESLRMHSFTQITVERMAVQPYTFKDGLYLPQETQVAFARYPYGFDPDVNEDPEKFDYKRHLKKRVGEDTTKFHFSSVSDDTLAWGAGMHACPGRFLAQEALKLIFVNLVTRYEVKFDTAPGKDMMMGMFMAPDVGGTILVRERKSE